MLFNTDNNWYCTFSWNRGTSQEVPSRQRSHPLLACFTEKPSPLLGLQFQVYLRHNMS